MRRRPDRHPSRARAARLMSRAQPLRYVWWLVSDASGIVALVLISASVMLGLAMAARVLTRPSLKRACPRLHEQVALTALAAIAVHGLALLGDHWLKPGWRGITIPFALSYRPGFTGIGIIAGYLAVLLGPSFYLRRRIGARRWRTLHRCNGDRLDAVSRPRARGGLRRSKAVAARSRARPVGADRLPARRANARCRTGPCAERRTTEANGGATPRPRTRPARGGVGADAVLARGRPVAG